MMKYIMLISFEDGTHSYMEGSFTDLVYANIDGIKNVELIEVRVLNRPKCRRS